MTHPPSIIVRIKHVRQAGLCVSGLRDFCEDHGLDVRKLVREGYPMSEVQHITDANAQRVFQVAVEDQE